MRFQIRAEPQGGLRLIGDIPDHDICQIEGRNGVGKTAALRLLQLCTGDQPYTLASRASWVSFRRSIGPVRITAEGLRGGETIEWRLTPEGWPETPDPVGSWLGEILVSGRVATLNEVRRLLRIFRVPGEETLPAAIASQIQADAAALRRAEEVVLPRVERLETRMAAFLIDLRRFDQKRLAEGESRALEAERELSELLAAHREARVRLGRLNELARVRTLLSELRERGPDLDWQLSQVEAETIKNQEERTELESQAALLRDQADRSHELANRLSKEEQRVTRLRQKHRTEAIATAQLAAELGVGAGEQEVEVAQRACAEEAASVAKQLEELGATPRLIDLTRVILVPLEEAEKAGVGGEAVAETQSGTISVAALASGVRRRRQSLEARPAAELGKQLAAASRQLSARAGLLKRLRAGLTTAERTRSNLRSAEARLQQSRKQLTGEHAEAYRKAVADLDEAKRREIELAARLAQLKRLKADLGGGQQEENLALKLAEGLVRLGIADAELDIELASTKAAIDASAATEARLGSELEEARGDVARQRSALDDVVDMLNEHSDYSWLRNATQVAQRPARTLSQTENVRRVKQLEMAAVRAEGRMASLRNTISGLVGTLDAVASSLPSGGTYSGPIVASTLRHYEDEFTDYFNQKDFREAMFGTGVTDLRVDLTERSVSWASGTEEPVTRPFEAFSSGEKAFAYTRAKIEEYAKEGAGADNRVIALDEFGAYIARDRLERLIRFLDSRVRGHLAEQILVILPLAHNYEAQIKDMAPGPARDLVAERLRSLDQRGYFAEPFVSALL